MKKSLSSLIAVALLTASGHFAVAGEKWDMPVAYSEGNFQTQAAKDFAEAVKIATGGELEIIVHSGGSLFKGGEIKRAVQTGQAPIGDRLLSAHANEDPLFAFDSVPFLATSYADSDKLYKAALPQLQKLMEKNNLVLLYSIPWPPQGVYANKALNSVADLKGLKFRAYNKTTARMAELAGAVPVQIEAAELSQALATGVAESFISSGSTGYDRKVWEHLSHWYDARIWLPRDYTFVNKQAWEKLDKNTQNIIRGIAYMTQKSGTTRSEQLNGWYAEQLKKNGMTVEPAGEELAKGFKTFGDTLAKEWLDEAGERGQAVIDAYNKKQ